jgi:hypothetical protein
MFINPAHSGDTVSPLERNHFELRHERIFFSIGGGIDCAWIGGMGDARSAKTISYSFQDHALAVSVRLAARGT